MVKDATDWDEDDDDDPGFLMPRYGGTPVYLDRWLAHAKQNNIADVEAKVHHYRKKFFRNRRTPAEQAIVDAAKQKKFIAKYPEGGAIAIAATNLMKQMRANTAEQEKELLKKALQPPTPKEK